jgi:hypothetical protein
MSDGARGEVVIAGVCHEVGWPVRHGRLFPATHYSRRVKPPTRIVLHHDGCFSAEMCHRVLVAAKLSTHFCINNDGTIHQFLDPATTTAWAQGRYNGSGVAIDISNAALLEFAGKYDPPRPVVEQVIHGIPIRGLGCYPVQEEALAALCCVLCRVMAISPSVPMDEEGRLILGLLDPVPEGIIGHLHLTRQKWDPFGLDWMKLQERIRAAMG